MPISNALIQSAPRNKLMDAQMLRPTGDGSYLRQQFPQIYGFLGGLAGTAPDEMAGSVLDPNTAAVRQAAAYSYLPGLVASSAPLGKAGAGLGMLAGITKGAGKAEEALAAAKGAQQFNNSALASGNAVEAAAYQGSHKAPNAAIYGGTLDDLSKIMPADVYSSKGISYYGLGDPKIDSEWFKAAYLAKNNPDKLTTVYRAVPKGIKDINHGDWVTTSKTYAINHGENTLNGDYEILSKQVPAKTLSSEGYPYEFGYHEISPSIDSQKFDNSALMK